MYGGCSLNYPSFAFFAGLLSHHALKVGQQTGHLMETLDLVARFPWSLSRL